MADRSVNSTTEDIKDTEGDERESNASANDSDSDNDNDEPITSKSQSPPQTSELSLPQSSNDNSGEMKITECKSTPKIATNTTTSNLNEMNIIGEENRIENFESQVVREDDDDDGDGDGDGDVNYDENRNRTVSSEEEKVNSSPCLDTQKSLQSDIDIDIRKNQCTPKNDHLLSPPIVMRRVPALENGTENLDLDLDQKPIVSSLEPAELFRDNLEKINANYANGNGNGIVNGNENGSTEASSNFLDNVRAGEYINYGDDDDKEETNSMVSQYGSDIGELKVRLDGMMALDALEEEEEEEEQEISQHQFLGDDGDERSKSQNIRSENESHDNGSSSMDGFRTGEDDECVDSIDLASQSDYTQYSLPQMQSLPPPLPPPPNFPEFPSSSKSKSQSRRKIKNEDIPVSPVGAVSAVLRRFGHGMSRCTPSPGATSAYMQDENMQEEMWLSPRIRDQQFPSRSRSHRRQMDGANQRSRQGGVGSSVLDTMGITNCLSFDPESGKDKILMDNMRLPKRTHRKTKSWGTANGFDHQEGDVRDFIGNEERPEAQPKSTNKSESIVGRMMEGILSPRRKDKVVDAFSQSTPKRAIRFIGQSMTPGAMSASNQSVVMLHSPQRIDGNIEHEDALDLLSLLVDRSVAYNQCSGLDQNHSGQNKPNPNILSSNSIKECIDFFRKTSFEHNEDSHDDGEAIPNHKDRVAILDHLENTHTYAVEMKQAALSASTWLNAVGRSGDVTLPISKKNFKPEGKSSLSEEEMMKMDAHELRSALQEIVEEKDELNRRLNNELSQCRAEIGRLRTSQRTEISFAPPNMSILDRDGEDDSSESTSSCSNSLPNPSDVSVNLNSMGDAVNSRVDVNKETSFEAIKHEGGIKKLHHKNSTIKQPAEEERIKKVSTTTKCSTSTKREDNEKSLDEDDDESNRSIVESERIKIDAPKDFVSDETPMVLPPPPDHDLHSPIVEDLLKQWTSDSTTQESLLRWVENVTRGNEATSVPPLFLSGLSHGVRDGLAMHVFSLLLRRSDIVVDVTTRAHQHVKYDLAVSIKKSKHCLRSDGSYQHSGSEPSASSRLVPQHLMAFKASGSAPLETSVDDGPRVHNKPVPSFVETSSSIKSTTPSRAKRLLAKDEHIHLDTDGNKNNRATGGIVAGALKSVGGLLSRRRTATKAEESKAHISTTSSQFHANDPNGHDLRAEEEQSQPYHRVISAPIGKIGITFVAYRGHAMVSDIYSDSPLSGWIFPSDILIAVDEVCVSGMRVPEIVELLQARRERQRSLRVISSHAMTELMNDDDSSSGNSMFDETMTN